MAVVILLDFTAPDAARYCDGALFRDYFADGGLDRAFDAATIEEARAILESSYLGPDDYGVGVVWKIKEHRTVEQLRAAGSASPVTDSLRQFSRRGS